MACSQRRRAFTLVEILTVAAILAVLAAILYPVIGGARRSAGSVACLSNERQIGAATLLYAADHNDAFPFGPLQPGTGWALALQPFMKGVAMLRCPQDPTRDESPGPDRFVDSYAMNANLGGATFRRRNWGTREVPAATESEIHAPAGTTMFFEASDNVTRFEWSLPRRPGPPDFDGSSPSGNTTTRPGMVGGADYTFLHGGGGQYEYAPGFWVTRYATGNVGGRRLNGTLGSVPRHGERANYLACDGHVQALRPERVSGGANAVGETCDQGTRAGQGGVCAAQTPACAAGTGSRRYGLTFSTL